MIIVSTLFVLLFSMVALAGFSISGGPVRLLMFVPGILLYETIAAGKKSQFPWVGLTCFVLALVVTSAFQFYDVSGLVKFPVIGALFYIFCLDCFTSDRIATKFFSPTCLISPSKFGGMLCNGVDLERLYRLRTRLVIAISLAN